MSRPHCQALWDTHPGVGGLRLAAPGSPRTHQRSTGLCLQPSIQAVCQEELSHSPKRREDRLPTCTPGPARGRLCSFLQRTLGRRVWRTRCSPERRNGHVSQEAPGIPPSAQAASVTGVRGLPQGPPTLISSVRFLSVAAPFSPSRLCLAPCRAFRLPSSSGAHEGMFWNVLSPAPPVPISQMQGCGTVQLCPLLICSPSLCWLWIQVAVEPRGGTRRPLGSTLCLGHLCLSSSPCCRPNPGPWSSSRGSSRAPALSGSARLLEEAQGPVRAHHRPCPLWSSARPAVR